MFPACTVEVWHQRTWQTRWSAPSSFRRVRKGTETPRRWRWVRLCYHVMPTIVENWVSGSCWSGWTPRPVCPVGKHQKMIIIFCFNKKKHYCYCKLCFKLRSYVAMCNSSRVIISGTSFAYQQCIINDKMDVMYCNNTKPYVCNKKTWLPLS